MGVLDKLLDAVKLNDDYDDDYLDDEDDFLDDIDDEDDDFLESKPKKNFFSKLTGRGKKSDDFEDDDFEEEEEPVKAKPKFSPRAEKKEKESGTLFSSRETPVKDAEKEEKTARSVKVSPKITPMRASKRGNTVAGMEVCVIKPRSMEDTREIADTLLDNSTIILNLEGIDVELAQRITDFSSGACYSLGGRLQRISGYIFVMVPYNVDITGDLQNVLGGAIPSVRAGY